MKYILIPLVIVGLLGLVPAAEAKTLTEQLEGFHFESVTFTLDWSKDTDRASVEVNAAGMKITGDGARDLRRCIDDDPDCPAPELRQAAVDANNDGTVSKDEVDSFQLYLKTGLMTTDQVRAFLKNVRGIIKVDDQPASSISLSEVRFSGATGSTDSTDDVSLSATIKASYGAPKPASSHAIWMQRGSSNLTVADTFVVQTGKNWRIVGDSIKPSGMQDLLSKGRLRGSQAEFQSKDPLMFTMEYHKASSPDWGLFGASLALVGAAFVRRKV